MELFISLWLLTFKGGRESVGEGAEGGEWCNAGFDAEISETYLKVFQKGNPIFCVLTFDLLDSLSALILRFPRFLPCTLCFCLLLLFPPLFFLFSTQPILVCVFPVR